VCEGRRRHRDHTRTALRDAVVEVAVDAPAYRSYVRFPDEAGLGIAAPADEDFVTAAVEGARRSATRVDAELLDLLQDLLLGRLAGEDEADVALRFQQLTGPVAAKGEEDTALYRWLPLPHRCEVGADPGRPSLDAAQWHEAAATAQRQWPQRLTSLSTHDTKRSADVRARLAVLTTIPDEALAAFDRWWEAGMGGRAGTGPATRHPLVDVGTGWLVFHTLAGAHPLPGDRAWAVVEKSVKEAKRQTSWTEPDVDFEGDLHAFVTEVASDPATTVIVEELVARLGDAGEAAALAQLGAQLLAPGVPDVYQGGESWERSLVDPDNRRPVDPQRRRDLLAAAEDTDPAAAWKDEAIRATGLPRLLVLRAALRLRRSQPAAFAPGAGGAYRPLEVSGPDRSRVLAYGRGEPVAAVFVGARPGPGATVTTEAAVELPEGPWVDAVTGRRHEGGPTTVAELHADLPVALLGAADR
jgi:(1->4)-alpha-D-glucan 1-alpha-D-glucosylmutase